MQKNLGRIIRTSFLTGFFLIAPTISGYTIPINTIQPVYAEGGWKKYKQKLRRDNQKTRENIRGFKKSYKRLCDKIDGRNPSRRAKNIAGHILENVYGIPQAREMIEIIDKGPKYKAPWKRKRRK